MRKTIHPKTLKKENEKLYNEILEFHSNFTTIPPFSWMYKNFHSDKISMTPQCYCGNQLKYKKDGSITKYCSRYCMNTNSEVQMKRKIGLTKEVIEKRKLTNIEKYGGPAPLSSNDIKEKTRKTNIEKYGVENPSQNQEIKDKKLSTMLKNYGSYYFQTDEFKTTREKYFETNKHVNFKDYNIDELKFLYFEKQLTLSEISKIIDGELSPNCVGNKLKQHGDVLRVSPKRSSIERKICEFLDSINVVYETNVRFYSDDKRKYNEIDIYIPEKKLGIECNGMFWHSISHKERDYHKNKLVTFKEKYNIDLLQFWEIEINDQFDLVESIISYKLGILKSLYARKCELLEITTKEARKFCTVNHIQGFIGATKHYALKYDNDLVAYMSFGKSRYNKKYEWELLRFCNKKHTNVVGGANKLFKWFIKKENPNSIISYQDRRIFNGNLYSNLDFKFSHESPPNYFYYNGEVIGRESAQKHKLETLLKNFDESKTETENMLNNGYLKIYDCGQSVWIWKRGD